MSHLIERQWGNATFNWGNFPYGYPNKPSITLFARE
jgi:hypothetical protein